MFRRKQEESWKDQFTSREQIRRLWNREMPWLWAIWSDLQPRITVTVQRIKESSELISVPHGTSWVHISCPVAEQEVVLKTDLPRAVVLDDVLVWCSSSGYAMFNIQDIAYVEETNRGVYIKIYTLYKSGPKWDTLHLDFRPIRLALVD